MDNGGAFTDRLLDRLDIRSGETAIDVGCGRGDVTLRLAERVGSSGCVVGIDRDETALGVARERARAAGLDNVTFVSGDAQDIPPAPSGEGYDILTCRRVLMYLPDSFETVEVFVKRLGSRGRLAIQEHGPGPDLDRSVCPLNREAHALIWDTVRAEGADPMIGLALPYLLSDAGAVRIDLQVEAVAQTADQGAPTAMIIDVMKDRIMAAGTATEAELEALDTSTLDARLRQERREERETLLYERIYGVVGYKRASST